MFDFFDVYRCGTYLFMPVIWFFMGVRKKKGKEDISRFGERAGVSRVKRPAGRLVWFHGASVGETLSMYPLINKILEKDKTVNVLVTSGTRTSAKILGDTLPERVFHQYIPIDYYPYVKRFIAHFKPDVAIWFESEFWPNLMKEAHDNGTKMILVNGRISDRSFSRWKILKGVAEKILSLFDLIIAQSRESRERLSILSGKKVEYYGNIKFAALGKMDIDKEKAVAFAESVKDRHVFLAASTHPGEEEKIIRVHSLLKKEFPDIITVIIPRHPNRSEKIVGILDASGLSYRVRSRGDKADAGVDIYLADTMGETALFYSLCKVVFVGGSLVKFGGQNMIEPMYAEDAVLVGRNTFNFRDIVADALKANALIEVEDENKLADEVIGLFKDPDRLAACQKNASLYAKSFSTVCDDIYNRIEKLINENA